jgi:hypothetical protein
MEARFVEIPTSVEPPRWMFLLDYNDRIPKKERVEVAVRGAEQWCIEQFGPPRHEGWYRQIGGFFFWHEAHAMAFKMRWC